MNYFEEIILGKRSNWDLSFRFYLLSKSFITLRANNPLVVNCGCDSIAQHHKKKTLVHSNRTHLKSQKLSFCFKNVPAIVIDFFQPWLPKPRIASIILSFLYRCGLGNISLIIHLDTTLPWFINQCLFSLTRKFFLFIFLKMLGHLFSTFWVTVQIGI